MFATKGIRYDQAIAPDGMRLYAIGDVHGRYDLLQEMLERIDAEIRHDRPDDWRIVTLGDYVDRGPDSRSVIAELMARHESDPRHVVLAGNHDEQFAAFLDKPDPASLFVNYGGVQTAASYGVDLVTPDGADDTVFLQASAALRQAVPQRHADFVRALPRRFESGDFFFCHAGIRPQIALEEQTPDDLIWIRKEFLTYRELHPRVIVHGHTPNSEPDVRDNRVNVDTRAYESGRLTAFVAEGSGKRFLTVRKDV